MLAEVGELEAVEEVPRRSARDDLAAVPSRGDPRGEVHVLADVALLGEAGRSRVQTDAHPDRPAASPSVISARGRERPRRGREGEEEGVALRVHLDAALRRAGRAHDPPVLGERLVVRLVPELVQQPGRALDVGEEERDRARKEARAALCL